MGVVFSQLPDDMDDSKQNQADNLLAYLAATAPALFQLVAVTSVGLVDVLKLNQFVLFPQLLNLSNLFVVILSILLISSYTYWDQNKFSMSQTIDIYKMNSGLWRAIKFFTILAFFSLLVFLGILINKSKLLTNVEIWGYAQWVSYILGMTSLSFIVYIFFLTKIRERQGKRLNENFIPRLLDSLRRYGHIKNPDIIVESINKSVMPPTAVVKIKNSRYVVSTDFTGEMTSIASFTPSVVVSQT